MTGRSCERSVEVTRAAGVEPGGELARHVAACEDCRRAHLLTAALTRRYAEAESEAPRPSAGLLWWKSRLARELDAEAEALRPVAVAEAVVPAALLAALGGWLVADAATWSSWLRPLVGDSAATILPATAGAVLLATAVLVGLRLAAATLRRPTTGAH